MAVQHPEVRSCPVVEVAPFYWSPQVRPSDSSRIEIRQCGGSRGSLSLALWSQEAHKPTLVLETSDFAVVQTFIRDNIAVVITSGGNRDQVFVFQFKKGSPTLFFRQVTKGDVLIDSKHSRVTLTINGIYAGDSPPETKVVELSTDWAELLPQTQ